MAQARQQPDLFAQLADHIAQLCEHHHHVEKYHTWTGSRHREWHTHLTWHPPLLAQLRHATQPRTGDQLAVSKGKPAPKAPANLDALDRLHAIDIEVTKWRNLLGGTPRGTLEADLKALVGLTTAADAVPLAADVDRWRLWCLTLAGWQTPPWQPHAPCPRCDKLPGDRAGLRVRLDQSTACCVSCGAVWGPDVVGVLADHVRRYREGTPSTQTAPEQG